ncbi:hypothetical protein TWF569_003617 [Orbilia oligospora]|uniref:Hpc2-related domain-containing protein n=1 Tax=Orbilia oligospora TaxID=2813651 RepID=A0A7C8NWT2_ORBOL|nr:hypothetical protein TWF103_005474 [Orbilia oligospora]KAF3110691.1 hypothetical protein TWF102_008255 [Orbilia oligospora]KAF3119701.1 hypothetical protein TWF569_003617 [Orbilia oligospora]KAF3132277.1 hypothetical protein TWF703_007396 [Orbilia oligospora]
MSYDGSPGHGHRHQSSPYSNGINNNINNNDSITVTPRPSSAASHRTSAPSRPAGTRSSGRFNVSDLVESDPDAPSPSSKSLKRKASPERSSNDYSPYPTPDHLPSKQNRASASPALSALLNGSPPLRPTQGSPITNPPPSSLTPPTINASLSSTTITTTTTTLSPPQPKAITEITKSSSSSSKRTSTTAAASATSAPASPKPASRTTAVVAPAIAKSGGLLAGTFGDVALGDDDPEPPVPTVVLQISLNGETNKYIDVSKLAEEKYGWAALNPRLARAKLRPDASGDEAMMDASESESAMEDKLVGMASDAGMSGLDGKDKPKKRKRRVDEYYDANDPFIDDSEMLWEEQAAASKDGFFVYSGPLVPEGERPQIERTNGGPPKRGRGRGGRGAGTGRGGGNTGKATAPRKPRVTKAVKEKMEKEKEEREKTALKMAAAAAQTAVPPTQGPRPVAV